MDVARSRHALLRRSNFLSKPRKTARGMREPSLRSAAESRRYLTIPECAHLSNRLLSDLRPGDLEKIRDACAEAGRNNASLKFVMNSKAALSFARRKYSHKAGLEGAPRWWQEVEPLDSTLPSPREQFPHLKELARVLYLAETKRTMPDRKIKSESSVTVLAGLWFVALTGQRTTAALSLRKEHILPWSEGPRGWRIAYFPAPVMKGKRPHSLPIPHCPLLERIYHQCPIRIPGRVSGSRSASDATLIEQIGCRKKSLLIASMAGLRIRRQISDSRARDLLDPLPRFASHDDLGRDVHDCLRRPVVRRDAHLTRSRARRRSNRTGPN